MFTAAASLYLGGLTRRSLEFSSHGACLTFGLQLEESQPRIAIGLSMTHPCGCYLHHLQSQSAVNASPVRL